MTYSNARVKYVLDLNRVRKSQKVQALNIVLSRLKKSIQIFRFYTFVFFDHVDDELKDD